MVSARLLEILWRRPVLRAQRLPHGDDCCSRPFKIFVRRLIRIIPLYWLCTLGVFCVACAKPELLHSTKPDFMNLVKSLLFIPYRKESGAMQPVLFLGWTLEYEMYFYLVFALALQCFRSRPLLWVSVLVAAPVMLTALTAPKSDLVQFYGQPMVLEFVLGIGAFCLCQWQAATFAPPTRLWPVALGCLVILLKQWRRCMAWVATSKCGWECLRPLLVLLAVGAERSGSRINNAWPPSPCWERSYVLYLTHPYVLQVGEKILGCGHWPWLAARVGSAFLLVGLAVAVACMLHVWVELPILEKLRRAFFPAPRHKVAAPTVPAEPVSP